MSDNGLELTDKELDDILDEIMMIERQHILLKRPTTTRRSALSSKFKEIASRLDKDATD